MSHNPTHSSAIPPPEIMQTAVVQCPVCQDTYTGISVVDVHQGTQRHTITGQHAIHQNGAPSSGRGSIVTLTFRCESSHVWTLEFAFHKGETDWKLAVYPEPGALLPTLWRD